MVDGPYGTGFLGQIVNVHFAPALWLAIQCGVAGNGTENITIALGSGPSFNTITNSVGWSKPGTLPIIKPDPIISGSGNTQLSGYLIGRGLLVAIGPKFLPSGTPFTILANCSSGLDMYGDSGAETVGVNLLDGTKAVLAGQDAFNNLVTVDPAQGFLSGATRTTNVISGGSVLSFNIDPVHKTVTGSGGVPGA